MYVKEAIVYAVAFFLKFKVSLSGSVFCWIVYLKFTIRKQKKYN